MKSFWLKPVAAFLAASMLFSLASCSKKNGGSSSHSGRKITSDTPWYDANEIAFDPGYDKAKDTDYIYSSFAGSDEKYIAIMTQGNYKIPSNIDWDTYDYRDYSISTISLIDRETRQTVNKINLNSIAGDGDNYVDNAVYDNGIIRAVASCFDSNSFEVTYKEFDVDPLTGNVLDVHDMENGGFISRIVKIAGYSITIKSVQKNNMSNFVLDITSSDGSVKTVEVNEGNKEIFMVSVLPVEGTNVLIFADNESGISFFEMDLKTCELKKVDEKEYEWIKTIYLYQAVVGSDGNVYSMSPAGISKIDFKQKSIEEIFNFSWCAANRKTISNFELAEIGDDSFILFGAEYHNQPYSDIYNYNNDMEFTLIEFNKADKNPNTGKTILELYSNLGYTEDVISDAIMEFNRTNDKYYIEVTDRYASDVIYSYQNLNSDDELDAVELNYMSEMSNRLAMDIINGEAPDMFLDISYCGQLNSSTYLADLTPYVKDLDSGKYFTNIIDNAKVDGKLFNLPVCFSVTGIQTDAEYAGSSGVGFTTDEYVQFVKNTLNGKDVLTEGQAHYFSTLFSAMNDKFITNGKADFSAPEFAVLAEYVKENVQEKSTAWDEEGGNSPLVIDPSEIKETGPAIYDTCSGFYSYFSSINTLNGSSAILGLPSADGRGPAVNPYTSIAVSAQAYSIEACAEFVKLLISDEVQQDMSLHGSFTLNREIFKENGYKAVAYYNAHGVGNQYGYYGDNTHKSKIKFTNEKIDELENTILNCSKTISNDAAINLILVEEMPAYFTGQKELDDVVKIAQDRVQKILDERG